MDDRQPRSRPRELGRVGTERHRPIPGGAVPASLGLLYSAFTAWLGFEVNDGEYKVMGMAPYGQPEHLDKVHKVVELSRDGSFRLNMEYFSFHHSMEQTFSRKFEELFGEPRARNPSSSPATARQPMRPPRPSPETSTTPTWRRAFRRRPSWRSSTSPATSRTDRAHAAVHGWGRGLQQRRQRAAAAKTPSKSCTSSRAAGDSGGALGAALYAYHVLLGRPRSFVMKHAYWGQAYSAAQVKAALDARGVRYEIVEDEERLVDLAADELVARRVIGWHQGASVGAAGARPP